MRKLLPFLFLIFFTSQIIAQNATTIKDSTEVRDRPRISSEIVKMLPVGMSLEVKKLRGRAGELYVNSEFGYIRLEDVTFGEFNASLMPVIKDEAVSYVHLLLSTPPEELTEVEIMYLMLNEMRQQDDARRDLKKLKNAQVFQAIVTGVAIVTSIVVAISYSN